MLSDGELKKLLRKGDWSRLESETRSAIAVRVSKAAELYLLRALLEQGKMTELGEALAGAMQRRPRATLRFLEREGKRIPQAYCQLANGAVFSDLTSEAPDFHVNTRMRWPSYDVLQDKASVTKFLLDDVFANLAEGSQALPKEQVHVVTFGSCFAQNLYNGLLAREIRASTLSLEETVNTTFANRDILRFLYDGGVNATAIAVFGNPEKAQLARDRLLGFLRESTHAVLTVGVAAAFFSKDGEYTLISNPKAILRNKRDLVWRMSSVEENKNNLREAIALLRAINPSTRLFLTLSPVPLSASFSTAGVVYDDLLSKSTLRVAIHELLSTEDGPVLYWPSFEVVKWLAAHGCWTAFGEEDRVSRHPSRWLVDIIVDAFCRHLLGPFRSS
jgi:hypothetical protein